MGEVIEQGTADQVFNHPKEEKTKSYLKGLFY
jgi:phosphate transport system ATP-binding protein